MKKPILLGVEGESKKLIEKYNAGISYIPENKKDFLAKLEKIMDKFLYSNYQKGCENLALNYRRDYLAEKMLNIIKNVFYESSKIDRINKS